MKKSLDLNYRLLFHVRSQKLFYRKRNKVAIYKSKKSLPIKTVQIVMNLLFFTKLLPFLLSLYKRGLVHFLFSVSKFFNVILFHLFSFFSEYLLSPCLSLKCEGQRIDNFIADDVFNVRLYFEESKFPHERKELNLFFKLKVKPPSLNILLKSVFRPSFVSLRKKPLEKFEQMFEIFDGECLDVIVFVLIDLILVEAFNVKISQICAFHKNG